MRTPLPAVPRILSVVLVAALLGAACTDDDAPDAAPDQADDAAVAPMGADDDGTTTTTDGGSGDDGAQDRDRERERDDAATGDSGSSGGFDAIPSIVEEVEPSVVTVVTDAGIGSGVVYSEDGIIVTNNHVVEGRSEFTVVFADQTRVPATVVATAPLLDLAILDADRADLPPATFADELPRVGELAIAIGSPLGLEQTVTAGIVSGLNRAVPGSARITQSLVNLIQTDAPISPGNSGGALVDGRGQVIGINVAYLPPAAGAVSLGFAIPSPEVRDAVEELLSTGRVQLSYIGIVPAELSPQIAERFGMDDVRGVLVADVSAGGPATIAGLEPGDLITSIDGEAVGTVESFLGLLRRRDPGDSIEVEVLRDGEERSVDVTLADRPTS